MNVYFMMENIEFIYNIAKGFTMIEIEKCITVAKLALSEEHAPFKVVFDKLRRFIMASLLLGTA